MAKLASSNDTTKKPRLYMEVQTAPSIEGLHVFQVQPTKTWMDLILSYIRDSQLPLVLSGVRKTKVRSSRFTVVNDKLYKRGFSLPYLKCLSLKEAKFFLQEIHDGVYGNHSGPQSLEGKVI